MAFESPFTSSSSRDDKLSINPSGSLRSITSRVLPLTCRNARASEERSILPLEPYNLSDPCAGASSTPNSSVICLSSPWKVTESNAASSISMIM